MTQINEDISVDPPAIETIEKGDLKVIVSDICNNEAIENVEVTVGNDTLLTNSKGEASFIDITTGPKRIKAKIHFKDYDYSTFILHYPRILNNHEAKSSDSDLVDIIKSNESTSEIELNVFKAVGDIIFYRRHIDIGGADEYGHWWTVVNDTTSYGWWPKYSMGDPRNRTSSEPTPPAELPKDPSTGQKIQHMFSSAVYSVKSKAFSMRESSTGQTLMGVEGDLNGIEFGGTKTQDPHHLMGDEGDEQYQPVRSNCFDLVKIVNNITVFANAYSGEWSWRLEAGNHCHTFQKNLMKDIDLLEVKVLK